MTEEPLRVAVALDDELAGATVTLDALRGQAFILAEAGTALRDTVMAAAQRAGFSPLPLFEVGDPLTVRYLVRAGLGISLVPASWLERPGPVVGAADLDDPPCHRLQLLTPAAGTSPAGRLLHERLLEL
jgi:DNA-binding transcriptional LysR family regulator